jgi:hypothetical protein
MATVDTRAARVFGARATASEANMMKIPPQGIHVKLFGPGTRGTTPATRWYKLRSGRVVPREPGDRLPRGAVRVEVSHARPEQDDGSGIVTRPADVPSTVKRSVSRSRGARRPSHRSTHRTRRSCRAGPSSDGSDPPPPPWRGVPNGTPRSSLGCHFLRSSPPSVRPLVVVATPSSRAISITALAPKHSGPAARARGPPNATSSPTKLRPVAGRRWNA